MKRIRVLVLLALAVAASPAVAQQLMTAQVMTAQVMTAQVMTAQVTTAPFTTAQVLAKLDEKARVFTSVQASIRESSVNFGVKLPNQSGKLYIAAKANAAPRILFDITDPKEARQKMLLDQGWGIRYRVSTNSYQRAKVKNDSLEYVLLGFGASAATINKGYKPEVKGMETIEKVQAIVLELTSIVEATQAFPTITLWINPQTWVPVQIRMASSAKIFTDYTYTNVQLNRAISNSVFELPKNAKEQ